METAISKVLAPDFPAWLRSQGVANPETAQRDLSLLVNSKIDHGQLEVVLTQLFEQLPNQSDPDRAISNLERCLTRSQSAIAALTECAPEALTIFGTSQYLSDLLIYEADLLCRLPSFREESASQAELQSSIDGQLESAANVSEAMLIIRQFKREQTLRIAYRDLIESELFDVVTLEISMLAEVIVQGAVTWLQANLTNRYGRPLLNDESKCRFVILALGKLGGRELNYSSDIDLIIVYEGHGQTAGGTSVRRISNEDYFSRLARELVKLLGEPNELGFAYRVDLRLRPNGASGKICNSFPVMLQYYDLQGRTWERQALVKARPIAGEISLGQELLSQLAPWIYRRNLSRADISGIKALKRKIERRAFDAGEDKTNIKTGHGGIRDVEFVIQFMQLLNAGELPEIRSTNTLEAIRKLEKVQSLSTAESTVLSQNYKWLRRLEHCLQIMFDLQTHTIPKQAEERAKLARKLGITSTESRTVLEQFEQTLEETTRSNRAILDHLLHNSYGMAFGELRNTIGQPHRFDTQSVPLEVDLILDPDPDPGMVEQVLGKYGFLNPQVAHQRLMELAKEQTRFLSSRRCKHFLASVAPALLAELAKTPDPDNSLNKLASVSDSLGAKGVLWELFSFNPPTLSLYVRLCASSDYLITILRSNPGMIDELVDALQLEGLPDAEWLYANLDELSRGAEDLVPIIHSFKYTQHIRVGIRDILGRDDVRQTHRTLSNVAEACLKKVAARIYEKMLEEHVPKELFEAAKSADCPLVILGLGKLGGREPNYHSDLDLVFVYDSHPEVLGVFEPFLNGKSGQYFFSELAAAITKFLSNSSNYGKLFDLDCRLRPTGKSGSLAVSLDEFQRYFQTGQGHLWERQALCKARPVFGTVDSSKRVMNVVVDSIKLTDWQPQMAAEIYSMRMAMEKDCSEINLKRGKGGTVDVEFAIQMLQLKYANQNDDILVTGTLEAIERLLANQLIDSADGEKLKSGYQLLRRVEARLRLMNTTARHDLPTDEHQLNKLAYLLNYANAEQLIHQVAATRSEIRQIFDRIVR